MAENSRIGWTRHTWNLWTGCAKVSAGCRNCYAEGWAKRTGRPVWGLNADRPRTTAANWRRVHTWNREAERAGERHRVFVGSLMDWAEGRADQQEILADFWPIVRQCEHLDFLMLTKRPQNIAGLLPSDWWAWPNGYPNVWLMTSVEDATSKDGHLQDTVVERVERLLAIPAVVHGVSYEPALGPLARALEPYLELNQPQYGVSWVIYGGESGPGWRPENKQWARDMRDLCHTYGVAFFHKQSAGFRNETGVELDGEVIQQYPRPRQSRLERLCACVHCECDALIRRPEHVCRRCRAVCERLAADDLVETAEFEGDDQ